jgi:hypothetical protein
VRCLGYHTPDRTELPTQDLPLATCILPVTSASIAGIGLSATGIANGSWVFGFFRDGLELQDPVILGTVASTSVGQYDLGYDPTTNLGFGDPHGAFSDFFGPDIPNAASINSTLSESVLASQNPGLYGTASNSVAPLTSFDDPQTPYVPSGDFVSRVLGVANSQINVTETSDNQGPGIEKYWTATDYKRGYADRAPYCAAFACWCIQQTGVLSEAERPKTASAFGFETWAKGKSFARFRTHPRSVRRGDIIILSLSHIGFACTDSDVNGVFKSIDGNTPKGGGLQGVAIRNRRLSMLRSAITIV